MVQWNLKPIHFSLWIIFEVFSSLLSMFNGSVTFFWVYSCCKIFFSFPFRTCTPHVTCLTKSLTQNWNLPNNTIWNPNQGSGNLHPNCFEGYEWIVANLLNFFKQKAVGVADSVGSRWKMLFLSSGAVPKFSQSSSMTWWNVCSIASLLSLNS